MSISSKYRFFIESASITLTEVYPISDNFSYSADKSSITRNLIKEIGSDVMLWKGDYSLLKTLEDNGSCEQINFYVDTYCGAAWVRDFNGVIKLRKCVWNLRDCKVKLGIEHNDISKCLEDKSNEKFNIELVPFHPAVFEYQGFIESITCPATSQPFTPINSVIHPKNNSCITIGQGWVFTRNFITNITATGTSGFYSCTIETDWKRQRVNGGAMPLGSGWIALGSDWVRPVPTVPNTIESYGDYSMPLAGDIKEVRDRVPLYKNNTPQVYENGLRLDDTLTFLANTTTTPCTYSIISDFFSINPDGTHPTNTAYTNALANYYNIILWKSADVKRPFDFVKSTKMFVTMSDLIEQLKALFKVEAFVYQSSGITYLRIEHESYFDSVTGLDVSAKPFITGKTYSYEAEKLPREERFFFASLTDQTGGTFDGYPIQYAKDCSDAKTTPEIRAGLTYTNMRALYDNDNYPDESLVIAACSLFSSQNFVISNTELNDYMTWDKLQESNHYYNRPFTTGTINGVAKTFVKDKIKKEEVSVLEIDNCVMNAFNSNRLVNSLLGWSKVHSFKYDAKSCKLSLSLLR